MFGKNKKVIMTAIAIVFCASGILGILGSPLHYDNQKTTKLNGGFGGLRLTQVPGLSSEINYSTQNKVVKPLSSLRIASKSHETVEVRGIEPRRPWMISQVLDQPTPTVSLLYHKLAEVKILAREILAREIFGARDALAQDQLPPSQSFWVPQPTAGGGLPTYDTAVHQAQMQAIVQAYNDGEQHWLVKKWEDIISANYAAVFDSMLQNFSRQFASQVANKITKGGPGGETFGWDVPYPEYLKNAALTAAGDLIGSLSQVWGIDLCAPPLISGKLEMTMALINEVVRPPKPRCEWTEIQKNWMKMTEADYLEKFSAGFDPKVNYLGGSFALREKIKTAADAAETAAMLKRGLNMDVGFKPLTDIGGWIKTPATFIAKSAEAPFWEDLLGRTGANIGKYGMGNILAPALDTFITTVAGNLIERWTTQGMLDYSVKDLAKELNWLKDPNSAGTTPSVGAGIGKTAADFEKGFTRPKFESGGNRDILSELSTCPFPENPGPTSCVIDSNFSVAVRQKMTVGDAIKQNYLNGNAVFGFASKDAEPKYNEGYPLRSMRILRRYRIIPVGWEIAAEYINMQAGDSEYSQYSLKDMVDCYSANDAEEWCRGLVDPDWILKAPANSCEQKAYGQEIVSEYFIGQSGDTPSKRVISRNQFCAVDKSCVLEADNGKCLKWGYCAEEKKIWRFKGDACDEQFNTCLELTRNDANVNTNQRENETAAYLKNTLDYGVCDASNAGCRWYCADGTWNNGAVAWECEVQAGKTPPTPLWKGGENNGLFFDRDAESCDEKNEGCHKFLRFTTGANILYNGGFTESQKSKVKSQKSGEAEDIYELKAGEAVLEGEEGKFYYWSVENSLSSSIKISMADGAAKIEAADAGAGIFSYDASDSAKMANSMMPEGYSFDFSKSYILSADIKVEKGNAKIGIKNAGGTEKREAQNTKTGEWERLYVYLAKETFLPESIYIYSSADDAVFYADNVKLEEIENPPSQAPSFAEYENTNNTVYIKKAPDYLATKCIPPRFTETADIRPAECKNYATECKEEEAGCAKYTPTNGDPWIPAILSEEDKCDPECVNYKEYKQSATNFSHEILNVDFIADNPYVQNIGGDVCPAQEIGCTEFTNLDKLEKGGEAREYYSELKQCVATDANGAPIQAGDTCGTFYTWSGSDTAGYELNTYYLQKTSAGAPVEISNPQDLGECNGPEDLATNYNCREFYNEAGTKYYAIYRNTVKCSENCKPYRRTRENLNESACSLYRSEWLAAGTNMTSPSGTSVTVSQAVCKMEVENCLNSGGNWINNECIYKAIPGEGIACAAQNSGCNEYQGTTSGNVKTVLESYFEDGSNDGWTGGIPSSQAVIAGPQSLTTAGASVVKEDNSGKLKAGNNYVMSFLAYNKTAEAKTINVVFKGSDFYAVRKISLPPSEWKDYKASVFLSGDLDKNGKIDASDLAILAKAIANEMSVTSQQRELADIDGNGKIDETDSGILSTAKDLALTSDFIEFDDMASSIYLDNIVIKEIQGNIYRIKDSWTVPAVCDSPKIGAQLRCAEYTDNYGNLLQIDNFSKFCSSEAVGCEEMIDTANSESVFSSVFNSGDASKIETSRDELVYFVNDSSKYCYGGADDPGKFKGCQKFAVPQFNQEKTALATGNGYVGDVYIINDPDSYDNIICKGEALECDEYKYNLGGNQGSLYFKNPSNKTCEFNAQDNKWYKTGGKNLCPAVININLTIGNAPVSVPTEKWAGICPAEQSGCAEYIDPLSDNEPNEVVNGGFEQDIQGLGKSTNADGPDDWSNVTGCMGTAPAAGNTTNADCCDRGYSKTKAIKKGTQRIFTFEKDTLYTLSARAQGNGAISVSGCSAESPDNSMIISETGDSAILSFSNDAGMSLASGRFYLKNSDVNGECLLSVNADNGFVDEVNIQKSGLYYYNSDKIDKAVCQNKVNTSEGCILVNEREYTPPASHKPLTYSADIAYGDDKGANFSCVAGIAECSLSANEIIKVEPDRVCGKWLQEGNTEIGESGEVLVRDVDACVTAKSDGSCARIVVEPMNNMNFKQGNVSLMKNISGLSKVGFEWEDKDKNIKKIDGYYPVSVMSEIGQYIEFTGGFEDGLNGWNATTSFSVIDNPVDAQKEDLDPRAPVGKGFAKLSGGAIGKLTEPLPVSGGLKYILSGYINTRNINTNAASGIYVNIFNGDTKLGDEIKLEIRQGIKKWNYVTTKFTTPSTATKIVVTIENRPSVAGSGIAGSSYFDEIAIHPSLAIYAAGQTLSQGESLNQSGMAPSLCKVYPEENSLSCEYKGDNDIRYLGTKGYCLEYDRAPGDPSVCISWYPIDIIRGEEGRDVPPLTFAGFDEGPLYYCLEAQFLESRQMELTGHGGDPLQCFNNDGYCTVYKRESRRLKGPQYYRWCQPNERAVLLLDGIDWSAVACGQVSKEDYKPSWYYYNGNLLYEFPFNYNPAGDPPHYPEEMQVRCAKIVQVALSDGTNGAWTERLKPNSKYTLPNLSETLGNYSSEYSYFGSALDAAPYGAIPLINRDSSVAMWDGESSAGNQPLSFKVIWDTNLNDNKGGYVMANYGMGLPYSCANPSHEKCETPVAIAFVGQEQSQRRLKIDVKNDIIEAQNRLKNLFTKSFGAWEWQDKTAENNSAGYYPVESFKYLVKKDEEIISCPVKEKITVIAPQIGDIVITDVYDKGKNNGEYCWIAWEWQKITAFSSDGERIYNYLYKRNDSYNFTDNNNGVVDDKDEAWKNEYKCKNQEVLATTVENILTSNTGASLRPIQGNLIDNKMNVNVCQEYISHYKQTISDIYENSAASMSNTKDVSSEGERIITNTKEINGSFYEYIITMEDKASYTWGNILSNDKCGWTIKNEDGICKQYRLEDDIAPAAWDPPTTVCAAKIHKIDELYCAVKPIVANVKINGGTGDIKIRTASDIVLSYNSIIDPNQEPLTGYYISWGDGEVNSVERKRKEPQPLADNPHKFGHRYYYNDTVNAFAKSGKVMNDNECPKNAGSQLCCFTANKRSECGKSDCCFVRPSIRIKDNWGWCNNGEDGKGNSCLDDKSGWAAYNGWIIVTNE